MNRVIELKHACPRLVFIHAQSFDDPWTEKTIDTVLKKDFHCGFALERLPSGLVHEMDKKEQQNKDQAIQSFVLLSILMDEAEILTLATDPAVRGKGFAKTLLREVAHILQGHGINKLILEVAIDNLSALKLYKGLGFETVGRRKNYYKRSQGQSMDAEIMALNLAQKVAST